MQRPGWLLIVHLSPGSEVTNQRPSVAGADQWEDSAGDLTPLSSSGIVSLASLARHKNSQLCLWLELKISFLAILKKTVDIKNCFSFQDTFILILFLWNTWYYWFSGFTLSEWVSEYCGCFLWNLSLLEHLSSILSLKCSTPRDKCSNITREKSEIQNEMWETPIDIKERAQNT